MKKIRISIILIVFMTVHALLFAQNSNIGLVGYWPLDGNANDVHSNNVTVVHGGASFVTGTINQAASLDGVNDYIQVENNANLNFGTGDFSISLWFKSNVLNIRHDLFTKKNINQSPNNNDLAIFINTDNMVYFYLKGSTSVLIKSSTPISNDWIHVVAIRESGNIKLHVNNSLSSSGTSLHNISSDGPIRIGSNRFDPSDSNGSPTLPFNGLIDEVYIYNRALSIADVSYLYSNITNPTTTVWTSSGNNIYYQDGNVGIGTDSPQSAVKLDVRQPEKDANAVAGYVYDGTGILTTATIGVGYATAGTGITTGIEGNSQGPRATGTNIGGYFWASGAANNYALITGSGNVGIGTTNPTKNLTLSSNADVYFRIEKPGYSNAFDFGVVSHTADISYTAGTSTNSNLKINTNNVNRIYVGHDGKIGIGTTNPSYKLSVKGTIGCGEVIVENTGGWADFVFEPDYNLMTLKELETFIKTNKHLPEIPTSAEVKEKGISVGEMNAKLLQKIEELTLYVIELQKKNEEQDKRIKEIGNK